MSYRSTYRPPVVMGSYTGRYPGMGDTLTDWACDSASFARSWRTRVSDTLSTGAIAAVLGASAAGLIGGLLGRPIVGAAIGGAIGWGAHAIWTAPLDPGSNPPAPSAPAGS